MKVFEYVIVHRPKSKKRKPSIVGDDSFFVLAETKEQATLEAGRTLDNFERGVPVDEVEIIVRPFV